MFLPKESTCSKWKYLLKMDLFFPKGYIFAPIISCADLFYLHILLTSGLHWNGNIFSKWKTNLHLPHRLAQSPLGVTKPENGILNIKKLLYLGKSKFFWYDPARFFFLSVMRSFLWGQWRLWWLFYKCCWIHHLHCKPALVSSNWSISSILEKRQWEVKSYLSTIKDQLLRTSSAGNDHLHLVRFGVFLLIAFDFATSSESETDRRVPVSNILTRVGGTANVKMTKLYIIKEPKSIINAKKIEIEN